MLPEDFQLFQISYNATLYWEPGSKQCLFSTHSRHKYNVILLYENFFYPLTYVLLLNVALNVLLVNINDMIVLVLYLTCLGLYMQTLFILIAMVQNRVKN